MVGINIICVGKLGEAYWTSAQAEYEKRLSAYCKLNIVQITPAHVHDADNQSQIESALAREADLLLKYMSDSYNIALCVEGQQLDSHEFARHISTSMLEGVSRFNFLIGSSHGLSQRVKDASRMKLSISRMTMAHQLCRIVLLEQIYRGFSIIAGGKYHK